MTNEEMNDHADRLEGAALNISHPLLPTPLKAAIQAAAVLVVELVRREVKRDAKSDR